MEALVDAATRTRAPIRRRLIDLPWAQWFAGTEWMTRAACKNVRDVRFFGRDVLPGRRGGGLPDDYFDEAYKLCGRCPVVRECGEYADTERIEYGVWGGRFRDPSQTKVRR